MTRTRIKICGITRPEDGVAVAHAGADAIGLVFYAPSPRAVSIAQAQAVAAALPPMVTKVALFVDAEPALVESVLAAVPIDLLQFHGDELPADCDRYAVPYIKVAKLQAGFDLLSYSCRYPNACGILADTYSAAAQGGTGETFDWSLLPPRLDKPLILAGGLTPANVADAVRRVRPFAVDVSGGVEAGKGIKDTAKITAFVNEVQHVDD
ncbi:MAG: phosphoribosylanthranilate isomerase [Gammaproteobacteria bacterium]